jgi:GTP-binding protein
LPFGGPDGGNGGNGGHVIFRGMLHFITFNQVPIVASSKVKDLARVKSIIKAKSGEQGGGKCCHGKNAEHEVIDVSDLLEFFYSNCTDIIKL